MVNNDNTFTTRLNNADVSIYGFEKWKGRGDNNDISAVAVIHWDFYTEMRSWGVKNIGAYATWVHIEFEVNWWNENDEEETEHYTIDSNDEKNFEYKWELDTEIDLQLGDCICPDSVEVDFKTKTITINF
jgi:hypothetical protein